MGMQKCNGSTTPGTTALKSPGGASLLQPGDVTHYRSVVGKLMWLIPLRPDLNFATKELSRALQGPTEEDYAKMKHLVKYLSATRNYEFTISPSQTSSTDRATITSYVDSDWAGCKATRKSTSGGVLHINGVCVHHYSRTQTTVALSSGEAELYAIGTGVAEALGLRNFLHELGILSTITVCTDSSAARSITTRHGVTKQTKHIQLRYLYMQELVHNGIILCEKILGTTNPSDILTKYKSTTDVVRHAEACGLRTNHYDYGIRDHTTSVHFDSIITIKTFTICGIFGSKAQDTTCLLYTSDAADYLLSVDLGGRRNNKKK